LTNFKTSAPQRTASAASATLLMQQSLMRVRTVLMCADFARELEHHRFGFGEGITQFDEFDWLHSCEGFEQLRFCDAVMADHEFRVCHVLLVRAAHHLGQDQVNRVGAEQTKVAQRKPVDWENVGEPVVTQENSALGEQMRNIK
jgi:hypothetical protein